MVLAMACLLSGCMAQMIRDDASERMRRGEYEEALKNLNEGVARYPDSVVLRAGQLSAREEAVSRLLASAGQARQRGQHETAEQLLKRALAIDPANERAKAHWQDVERDRRVQAAVAAARDLAAKGQPERALRTVEAALKEDPRDAQLRGLQRQLELEARKVDEQTAVALAETRPVTLEFRDANLKMLLEALSRNTGVNFIVDKDVRPDIRATVFLRQTRIEDALDLILSTNQLAKKVLDPTTVVVYPNTPDKAKEYQELVIRAFFLSSAEAKQTAALLRSVLKVREPFVDEKLNMIIVRETPEIIRLAERLIALQDQSEPEVLMDVEVLEVKTSRLTELGVKFPDTFSLTPLAAEGGLTLANARELNSSRIGLGVGGVTVNLKREVGDANTLANPKIRARNREKAKILIGDKLPVITTTSNGTNFVSENVSYVDVGLKVDVEPTVYLDDEVAIKVALEVSALSGVIRTGSGAVAYQIGTRNANTVLRLRDGETQLLAGLISNEDRVTASRVPGAGDLPIIGRLFSSQRDDGQRTEIVLSITPHIVRNIRRPDLNQAEFWSGTENNVRIRPLAVPRPSQATTQATAPASGPAAARPIGTDKPSDVAVLASTPPSGVPAAPLPAGGLQLRLSAPPEAKVGEAVAVAVHVQADSPLRGMPVQLAYDKRVLELVDIEEGPFLKQDGAATSFSKSLQAGDGRATVGALRNGADGAKGEGVLMTLRFKALAAGAGEVRLLSANPIASGERIDAPAMPAPAAVMVR
jgi:general secretion pathway protein D